MYTTALSLLKQIKESGYEGYIVGGYPRDQYRGYENSDIDICTSMPIALLEQTFHVINKQVQYGSCTIEKDEFLFEVTIYRKDYYGENRYPEIETVSTLEEDLCRRDFVMNTLCIDCDGKYVDLMGAKYDIDAKIIRSVGNPDIKFNEDPLRMIRAIRFASDLDFSMEQSLYDSILKNKHLLKQLSHNRTEKEIRKVKNQEKWNSYLEVLDLKSYLS